MRVGPVRQARSAARRRQIIEAALQCFAELGYERSTMADIRARSGASTGSIYHHFQSKDQLAGAVYLDGIRDWQQGFVEALQAESAARDGILAVVRFHLRWVGQHPEWARFLFHMRHAAFIGPTEAAIEQSNHGFFASVGEWFRPHVRAGSLRRLPTDVFGGMLMGPCMNYSRQWISGRARTPLDEAAGTIGEMTWLALAGPNHGE